MTTLTPLQILMANSGISNENPTSLQDCANALERYDEKFHLVIANTDIPLANTRYRILASSGEIFEGVTDSQGFTERVCTRKGVDLAVEVFDTDGDDSGVNLIT